MYFNDEVPEVIKPTVENTGDALKSFTGKQKVIIFGIAGLAIGFFLYKSWRNLILKENEDEEFNSLTPSESPRKIKILVVGLEGSGRTTFTRNFCKKQHCSESPEETIVSQFIKEHSVDVGELSISMWDVCGAGQNREIWNDIFNLEELDFIIFCVDSSVPSKFVEARKELHRFLKIKVFKQTPVILLATKQDKSGAVEPSTIYLSMNLENLQGTRPIHCTGIHISSCGNSKGFTKLYNLLATTETPKQD